MIRPRWHNVVVGLACAMALASCQSAPLGATQGAGSAKMGDLLTCVRIGDPVPVALDGPVAVESAKNEAIAFAVRLERPSTTATRRKFWLKFDSLKSGNGTIDSAHISAYQVLSLPANTNRADYVRQTGLTTGSRRLPSALLPLPRDKKGLIQLVNVRDGDRPTKMSDPKSTIDGPTIFYFDVKVPGSTAAGIYEGSIDLVEDYFGDKVRATMPVRLVVHDFALPQERHLRMVSRVGWEMLYRHWPKEFEGIAPRLLNRDEPAHQRAVRVMDELVDMGEENGVQVVFPRLQPTVKWPAGAPPQFDWLDYDTVVMPWLNGSAFADHRRLGYGLLPTVDSLDQHDPAARMEYWRGVASHFEQQGVLGETSAVVAGRGQAAIDETIALLQANSQIVVTTPAFASELPVAEKPTAGRIDITAASRVLGYAPGLVYAPSEETWPKLFAPPRRYLSVDMEHPTPYVGVGETERDVRQWAWLAYLQGAEMVMWGEALPKEASPEETLGPGEQVWFYPGSWFGVDEPLQTLQLKWARRAEEDFEYLKLAEKTGKVLNPQLTARLLSRPVEIEQGGSVDPLYELMTGTTEPAAWDEARRLIAGEIAAGQAEAGDKVKGLEELRLEALRWATPQARPTIFARDVKWGWAKDLEHVNWLNVRVGIDLYNATGDPAERNAIAWTRAPAGWQVNAKGEEMEKLAANRVTRVVLEGKFDLAQAGARTTGACEATFTSGFNGTKTAARMVLPVGVSERREGKVQLDGTLSDWNAADAIQNGPMVRMLNKPALQGQRLELASTPSAVYTAWGEDSLYVAFKVEGLSGADLRSSRNFVEYQDRRAWGEDLCEVLLQGIYTDGSVGPLVHVVCKPNGQWVERKEAGAREWLPAEASVLYAGKVDEGMWRGEVAIPWKLVNDPRRGRPGLLRFNFSQHKEAGGESASWAGPVDFGREEGVMGLLLVKGK